MESYFKNSAYKNTDLKATAQLKLKFSLVWYKLTNNIKNQNRLYSAEESEQLKTWRPLLALTMSLVIVFSLIASIQLQKNDSLNFSQMTPSPSDLSSHFRLLMVPAFSSQPFFEDALKEAQPTLITNSTRAQVYDFIVANPGIHFRGICTGLSIAIGAAEFHLGVLRKAGLISFVKDGKYKRFFASKMFSTRDMKLISLLRHVTVREILKKLSSERTMSHSALAASLSMTSQGLTWQMNRLKEEGVIGEKIDGIKVTYSINQTFLQDLPELIFMCER
jgi:DNA-binding transcriptional ArsR family regulator